jgi:glycosyltransferase involved in cell wall biosynthesis
MGGEKIMGRHAAGHGFLSALLQHGGLSKLTGMVSSNKVADDFLETIAAAKPGLATQAADLSNLSALASAGTYYLPEPLSSVPAWPRQLVHPTAWSLCGVTHTISSAGAMDMISSWLTLPLFPWDAVICTSTAVKQSAETILKAQAEYLRFRTAATRFSVPEMPIIPLGVDCAALERAPADQAAARAALGIPDDAAVVLFLGRLSWHAKANPAPMYLALEKASKTGPVVAIECGWHANDFIRDGFAEAQKLLCPSVPCLTLDGRDPDARRSAWCAADVFCSLSDNIQETFGLTPVEAMAAGLPSVVSDWDGYKDTVRHGEDGFLIPTLSPPPSSGVDLAAAHAMGVDNYDIYLSRSQLCVAVDPAAAGAALVRLCADPGLRATMGRKAKKRAQEQFDWSVIIRQYVALWAELGARREEAKRGKFQSPQHGWPARMDPFTIFANYPTATLTNEHVVAAVPVLTEQDVAARLQLRVAKQTGRMTPEPDQILEVWRELSAPQAVSALKLSEGVRGRMRLRAVMMLIKLGLATAARP